jgi:hypothetical protein
MVPLDLQTRAVTARIRAEGREGNPPGLSALALHWVSVASAECTRAQPDITEVKVAISQAALALMELSSRFEFNMIREATLAVCHREAKLPPHTEPKNPTSKIRLQKGRHKA